MDIIEKSIDILAKNISEELNTLKVVEECAELQEVLIKSITKSENLKPKKEKIIEEMGDVIFRIRVLARAKNIELEVLERIESKANSMYEWAKTKFE